MPEERFFEWDYKAGIVRQHKRRGECNRCGECCRRFIRYATVRGKNEEQTTDRAGVWQEIDSAEGRVFRKLLEVGTEPVPCPQLVGDLCQDHIDGTKRQICRSWPAGPAEIADFPACGYSFEVVDEWTIEEIEGESCD